MSKSELTTELDERLILTFMDVIILKQLKSKNSITGYGLIKYFHRRYHLLLSSGTIYSALYSLERQGYIEGNSDGRRRIYGITKKGEEFIDKICRTGRRSYAVFSSILPTIDVE